MNDSFDRAAAERDAAEHERIPSDRLPLSRALWFGSFIALLTQPWAITTSCNGPVRHQTGIELAYDDALFIPIFFFTFAMVAPIIARAFATVRVRAFVEGMAFIGALVAAPLIFIIPRVEILGKRTALWAADVAVLVAVLAIVDSLARLVANTRRTRQRLPVEVPAIEPARRLHHVAPPDPRAIDEPEPEPDVVASRHEGSAR